MVDVIFYSILVRVLVPLLIFRWPFYGFVFALIADGLGDATLVDLLGGGFGENYQYFDKILDLYMLTVAMIASLRFERLEKQTSIVLYAIRAIGIVAFEITKLRVFLVLFPNVFEFFFLFVTSTKKFWTKFRLTTKNLPIVILSLAIPKLLQELLMHYFRLDKLLWDFWLETKGFFIRQST